MKSIFYHRLKGRSAQLHNLADAIPSIGVSGEQELESLSDTWHLENPKKGEPSCMDQYYSSQVAFFFKTESDSVIKNLLDNIARRNYVFCSPAHHLFK